MDKVSRANEIKTKEGYWSLLWRSLEFTKRQLEKKAQNQERGDSWGTDRPEYGFCANLAGKQAERLGLDKVSLIEFGVAGGQGLVNLENHVSRLEGEYDVTYEIYGFDTGEGLPEPEHYADSPYHWAKGHFDMDEQLLRSKLNRSKLVLGNVENTVTSFVSEFEPAPIGAIYVDLDYYSSTKDALEILNVEDSNILPRVPMYFDDVLGGGSLRMGIPQIGELKAIREYNQNSNQENIGKLQFSASEYDLIRPKKQFAYHRFNHNMYTKYIGKKDKQIRLGTDN